MPGKKILLVEDNTDDVLLTLRALQRANILNEVVVARDGVEGLDYLTCQGQYATRDKNDAPVVVLLDLKMPRMGGLELLQKMRAIDSLRLLPVVILTSSKEERDICESYNLGANSYIQKPVDFDQFVQAIRTLGLYWLVLNVSPQGGCDTGG
ncbi:MAG: response regulator [Candidatus Thorarchaeota archaeon]|nr:MAG: response regulator [Candidatus Thorarchaeota archaeon]RLI56396.1 MAG: response regulator [Candidatus Thorarchaeota archaeon]